MSQVQRSTLGQYSPHVVLWRMEVNGDWRCLSPLKASGLDLVFTPPCSALSKADYSLIIDCLSPKSAVSFPLAWPVLLPGGTWFGVFWSPCNVPTDRPGQLSAGYFDSLVSAGRSFSPSSPLMHGNKDLPNLSQFLMEHTGGCTAIFHGLLQTTCSSPGHWCGSTSRCEPATEWGRGVPAGVRGVCWCLCCVGFARVLRPLSCPLDVSAGFAGFVPHWWEWGGRSQVELCTR